MADCARLRLLLGGWTTIFTHHFSFSFMATTRYYWVLNFQQDDQAATASYLLTIFSFAFTVILSFLQLKYQNEDHKSPFQTHPTTMNLAITSLLMYCLLYGIRQRFSSHHLYQASAHIIARAIAFFAFLSLLSIASVLFPESVRLVFYALCILLAAGDWLHSLYQKIKNWFSHLQVNGRNIITSVFRFPSVEHRLRLSIQA